MDVLKAYKRKEISIQDALVMSIDQLTNLANNDDRPIFGFEDVDSWSILMPCTTAMIAAPSGEYKTAYAIHIALMNAQEGKRVLYINLKDSADALVQRILFTECHIRNFDVRGGKLSDEQWKRIIAESAHVCQLPITVYSHGCSDNTISALSETIASADCDLVIIDDLNTIEDFECSYDSDKTIRCMKKIKQIALEHRVPIISLYCLNSREIHKRSDKRPMLSDVGYGSLLSYNDIIQFMYYNSQEEREGPACVEIITAKSNITSGGIDEVAIAGGKLIEIVKREE